MPAIDDPFGLAASLPGQLAELRRQVKDLSANNTQAASVAAAAATAAAASAAAAAASAQASIVTPVTAVASSTATVTPFNVTASMIVPAGATRCFYTATASLYAQSPTAFQVTVHMVVPVSGSNGYIDADAATLAGSDLSVSVGFLTGLTPGATLNFTGLFGGGSSGTFSVGDSRVQALAVFQP